MSEQQPVVNVSGVRKEYEKTVAIENISFAVGRGEIVGLLGANGAGKTTLIHMMLGLLTPTRGEINVLGMDIMKKRIEILQRCNFSSAYIRLPYNLTVFENLMVFSRIYCVKDPKQRIAELLDEFEITHLRNRTNGHLSAGEATRVNLCKAMLNKPEVLFLDEPTASLDPDIADKVRKMIDKVRRVDGTSILYTSHNMRDIEELCDRIIFLHKGNILAEGTPATLVEQFSQQSLEQVFINIARGGDLIVDGEISE